MAFVQSSAGVYVGAGPTTAHGVAVIGPANAGWSQGVAVYDDQLADGRIIERGGEFTERLPNRFFGVLDTDPVSFKLDNVDMLLSSWLLHAEIEDIRRKPVRVRYRDENTSADSLLYTGVIESFSVGKDVTLNIAPYDLSSLSTPLPKNRVTDLTSEFALAADTGQPINIVFGSCPGVNLQLIREDSVAGEYDYLVGETTDLQVEALFKNGSPASSGTDVVSSTSLLGPDGKNPSIQMNTLLVFADGTLDGFAGRVLTGADVGKEFRIIKHVGTTLYLDTYLPNVASQYVVIREYKHVYDRYQGRTAIRLYRPQISGGQRQQLSATVTQYKRPKKNFLVNTEILNGTTTAKRFSGFGSVQYSNTKWVNVNSAGTPSTLKPGPDNISTYSRTSLASSPSAAHQQTFDFPITDGTPITFSIWAKGVSLVNGRISITSNGTGSTKTSNEFALSSDWGRVSVTKSTGWGTGATTVTVAIEKASVSPSSVYSVWGAQAELGSSATYYEPVEGPGKGATLWSFPEAIRDLITSSVYGLGEAVDHASFEQAHEDLNNLFLRCQGCLPTIGTREAVVAKDVFEELCKVRGMILRKIGGCWTITVDKPGAAIVKTFGTEETPERNIVQLDDVRLPRAEETVATLRVRWGTEVLYSNGAPIPFMPYSLNLTLNTNGRLLEVPLVWVRDANTADRWMQYVGRKVGSTKTVQFVTNEEGAGVSAGDLVTLVAPRVQPNNLMIGSELVGDATYWVLTGVSSFTNFSGMRDPFNRKVVTTKVRWFTGTPGSVEQTSAGNCAGKRVVCSIWVRTGGAFFFPDAFTFKLRDVGDSEGPVLNISPGPQWKKYTLDWTFSAAAGGGAKMSVNATSTGNWDVFLWGAHMVFDYPRPYVRTLSSSIGEGTTYQVEEVSRENPLRTSISAFLYSDPFVYQKSVFPLRVSPTALDNPTTMAPSSPGAVAVMGKGTDITTTSISGVTETDSWAAFQFIMPSSNASGVYLQYKRSYDVGWQDIATINTADAAPSTIARAVVHGLMPGSSYDVRAIAFNQYGLYSLPVLTTFTAA